MIVTLKGFGDESADAKKERVFAVAAIFGTEDEWGLAMREWLRRTRGLPFHATDCEAVFGEHRQASLDLYRDLTQILAKSYLVGFAVALDLVSYREVFAHGGPPDWAYFKSLADVIGAAARTANKFNNGPDPETVKLEFTFDSRLESNGTAGTMYTALANQPEWADSGIFHTKITFDGGVGKSPRLEIGDLFAHESMKELDRKITGVPSKIRASYAALEATKKFHFIEHRREFWEELKAFVETPENIALIGQFDEWLTKKRMLMADGRPDRSMNNWYLFNAWLDNQDVLKKKRVASSAFA